MNVNIYEDSSRQETYVDIYIQEESEDILCLAKYIEEDRYKNRRILCYSGHEMHHIDSEEIYFVESINEILYIHTKERQYTSRQRLYEMEQILPYGFARASRSAMLNMQQVRLYKPLANGLMLAEFDNNEVCYISRKYMKELRSKIKEK